MSSLTNGSCWVYNYYGGTDAPNPTTCVVPTLPTNRNNNGNVMGYYYQDTVNTSLGTRRLTRTITSTGSSPR